MWLDLARHCKFGYIPKSLACYRIRGDSASARRNPATEFRFIKSCVDIQFDFAMEHLGRSMPPAVRTELCKKLSAVAYWLRESGQYTGAARYLWKRLRVSGVDRTWLAEAAKIAPHWCWRQIRRMPPRYPVGNSSTVAHAFTD
jgi:hypothetical protein